MIKKLPYVAIGLSVILLLVAPFFIKVNIECKSQFGDCPGSINSGLNASRNKNLFEARRESSKFLKGSFLVSAFSIQFKLPNIMLINIIAKKPYYARKDLGSGKFELVDPKGTIIIVSDTTNLPVVGSDEPLRKPGDNVGERDIFAMKLVAGVYQMYQVGYGTITNDALVVDMNTGVRVIFPLEGDPEVLLGALRLIYSKVTANYLGTYSQIDMRYRNPVLR